MIKITESKSNNKADIMKAVNLATKNLKDTVKPGDLVFINPNLVTHEHRGKGDIYAIITHPTVIEGVVKQVRKILGNTGKIVVADCPTVDAQFDKIKKLINADRLKEVYDCDVLDLREYVCDDLKYYGFKSYMRKRNNVPYGVVEYNLKNKSLFNEKGINPYLFRGAFSKRWPTIFKHTFGNHKYKLTGLMEACDVYISIPKLKTHKKVGMTCSLKGLVGLCPNKNYLIHWKIGIPQFGGDEYEKVPSKFRLYMKHLANDFIPEKLYFKLRSKTNHWIFSTDPDSQEGRGGWQGNDTCWRMVADLWQIVDNLDCKKFAVVDGIYGGDGVGPFHASIRNDKLIIAGDNLVSVDTACAEIMGFNPFKIKYLEEALLESEDTFVMIDSKYEVGFEEPEGWRLI